MHILIFLLFILYAMAQIGAGFFGIHYHLGPVWAWLAIGAGFGFRFTLPLTIGAFFGATDVWGWHWAIALLFVAPGLAFIVPGVILSIIGAVFNKPAEPGNT